MLVYFVKSDVFVLNKNINDNVILYKMTVRVRFYTGAFTLENMQKKDIILRDLLSPFPFRLTVHCHLFDLEWSGIFLACWFSVIIWLL